jgi:hypothetical protein
MIGNGRQNNPAPLGTYDFRSEIISEIRPKA